MYMFRVYWLCVYFMNHTWVNVAIVQMFSLLSNFVLVFSTLFFCMHCTCFVVKTQTNATIPDICLDVSDSGLKIVTRVTDDMLHNICICYCNFYPRDAMLARVIGTATCPSVCPSVRPSVTRRYCVKTKKASGMLSSPSGSPKTLVF